MYCQSCYIKTKGKKLINELECLEYSIVNIFEVNEETDEFYLVTIPHLSIGMVFPLINDIKLINTFDCHECESAFLAIAEMRDDTDKNQYFVDEEGGSLVNLGIWWEKGSLIKCLVDKRIECFNSPQTHRATPKEILDYFEKLN